MGPDPHATTVLLFTDIEGSTRLVTSLGSAYGAVLQDHHRLLRQVFDAHGGTVQGTEGDAFFVSFTAPGAALQAAVDGQRALAAHAWPTDAEVRVRMGLHAGEVEVVAGNHVGLDVHLASRVASAAHGRQILLSERMHALVARDLPVGWGARDLGPHRLKDFAEPQRLYQVLHPELPVDLPPLRAPALSRGNLPAPRNPFVGREDALADLRRRLAQHRLVTVVGAGGVGKTRLAMEVARQSAREHPDGVWLVELAAVTDPSQLPTVILEALGLLAQPGLAPMDVLIDNLQQRQVLLVVDNCEHLVAAAARAVDALLDRCPDVRLLATSREPLGIEGEVAWRLPSLDVPSLLREGEPADLATLATNESVRLFLQRGRQLQPDLDLTAASALAVASICRRLDGIPLALELAAGRLGSLRVEGLADRLDDRFTLLTGGSRTALSRQQTLRAAIDWSYELLDEQERLVLRALSVFVDGFTATAAEEVLAGDLEGSSVLLLLDALVQKSLVLTAPDGSGRFLLLETIRQYAREKLLADPLQVSTVRERHLAWAQAYARKWFDRHNGPRHRESLDALASELPNLHAAMDWAVANADLTRAFELCWLLRSAWAQRGNMQDAYDRVTRVLSSPGGGELQRARAIVVRAGSAMAAMLPDSDLLGRDALAAAQAVGDGGLESRALLALGGVIAPAEQVEKFRRAVGLAQAAGLLHGEQAAYVQLGAALVRTGELGAAATALSRGSELAELLDSDDARFFAAYHSGLLAREAGDRASAVQLGRRALSLAEALGDARFQAESHAMLRDEAMSEQDWAEALTHNDRAYALWRQSGRLGWLVGALHAQGYLLLQVGRPAEGLAAVEEGIALARRLHLDNLDDLGHSRGELLEATGRRVEAREVYDAIRASPEGGAAARCCAVLSMGLLEQDDGRVASARACWRESIALARDDVQMLAVAAAHIAADAARVGRSDLARALLPARAILSPDWLMQLRLPVEVAAAWRDDEAPRDLKGSESAAQELRDGCLRVLDSLDEQVVG